MSTYPIIGPRSIRGFVLPKPTAPFPSPGDDWQSEVIYFLLPDRFSDANEGSRTALDRNHKQAARGQGANWQHWARSGAGRWQGGTLAGISSKLTYIKRLGATALWIGPVFRQRRELNTFHGYSIQNFVEVDPRLGTTQDLIDLVDQAHTQGIRVILDIVFNHSGNNWVYADGVNLPAYLPYPAQWSFGMWRDGVGQASVSHPANLDEAVWPVELQDSDSYMRAGVGNLGSSGTENPSDGSLEFRRSDFPPDGLRKFNHYAGLTLADLILCYKYWIGLTDCDGFRIDTVKHVSVDIARAFTGAIKEYAASLGKSDFFLVAEIGGGDSFESDYLDQIDRHKMNAALDIGSAKQVLRNVARGLDSAADYFQRFSTTSDVGESRKLGSRLVSVVDDHDNLSCEKLRFSFTAPTEHQVVAALAIQFFSLSIPCIYYGTEQALSYNGPAGDPGYEIDYLSAEGWGSSDAFLREAMFGPLHPRVDASRGAGVDASEPGFGPFGTSGFHCFDESNSTFARVAELLRIRAERAALRLGRQYQRPLGQFGWDRVDYPAGEIIAWARILDDQEYLIVVNSHGIVAKSADVLVDFNLHGPGSSLTVLVNTAETAAVAAGSAYVGTHPKGSTVTANRAGGDGPAFISVSTVGPSEVLIFGSA